MAFLYIEVIYVCGFIYKFVNFLHETIESRNLNEKSVLDKIGPWYQQKN
jgi:hypothetical protein